LSARAAWGRALGVLVLVTALDQAAKAIVVANIGRMERVSLGLGIDLVNVRNRGVAFGFLSSGGGIVFAVTAAALALLVGYFALHTAKPLIWLPTGLLLGGAVGNLIDRARLGSVVDFVDFPLWPAFNLADAAITVGMVTLLYVLERGAQRA